MSHSEIHKIMYSLYGSPNISVANEDGAEHIKAIDRLAKV